MSLLTRSRRDSHPPSGDEEPAQISPTAKATFQRLKSVSVETNTKPVRVLTRSKTMVGHDNKTKQIITNRMSISVVEDLLECKLCHKRLQRPKMLPCQHTFCLACLQECVLSSDMAVKCPDCGVPAKLKTEGPDGIAELPPNLYLDSLLTALQQESANIKVNPDQNARCAKCQTIGASYCQHCRQPFCTVCWSGHISELKSQLPSLLDQLQAAKESLDHRSQDFQDVCEKLKEHIDRAVEIKIQSLRIEQNQLNKKTSELLEQGQQSFKDLFARINTAEETISSGTDFNALPDNHKKVGLFLQLHRMTSSLLQEVSHWGEARPIFNEESFQIDLGDAIRTGSETEEADDVFYEEATRNVEQVSSPDALSLYYRSRSFTPRINIGRSVLQRPAGVAVAPWDDGNHIYIAGTDSRQVLVIDGSRMKLAHQLTAPSMLYPHGIACCNSLREVFITDKWNHCIHVFSAEGKYKRQIGKKGHAEGQFQSPEGIASGPGAGEKQDEEYIYVCDTGNERVQIINPRDGSVVRLIGIMDPLPGQKYRRTEFNQPTGIAVSRDKIVVADMGNKRVKTYTLSGEKLNEFGSMGEAKGQFRAPECVAIDRLGFILVGDSGNARVQIFRPNGSLVKVFGNRGSSPGKFSGVSGITVTNNMDIIVTDSKNGSVQIF